MDEVERELFGRLEREHQDERFRERRELHERRAQALERPEARAEWDRLAAEEEARDAAAGGTPAQWADAIAQAVLGDWEPGDPLPDEDAFEAARDRLLAANADRVEHLIGLLEVDAKDVADRLWLLAHGLGTEDEP